MPKARIFAGSLVLSLSLLFAVSAFQRPPNPVLQDIPQGDPIRGGLIYDNWFNALAIEPPREPPPLWLTQDSNTRSGDRIWRCVSCHGWDYKGRDGAYGPGSPEYTGFPGVVNVVGLSPEQITAALDGTRNPDHDFASLIGVVALRDLVTFLRTKQIDINLLVNAESRAVLGVPAQGEELYVSACIECHGPDGGALNFGSAARPQFLADVAGDDPWRSVHKVRFGGPTRRMPSYEELGWSLQQVADVLAYVQTLPRGSDPADLSAADQPPNFREQGDVAGIIAGSVAIVAVIFFGLVWTRFRT
jgi:thiosulfate dehydrogenase